MADPSVVDCRCDGNPSGGACFYPDCQLPPPPTAELLGEPSVVYSGLARDSGVAGALNTLRACAPEHEPPAFYAAIAVVETALADETNAHRTEKEWRKELWHKWEAAEARAVAAEAERDTLRQALEQIAALNGGYPDDYCALARAVLSEENG